MSKRSKWTDQDIQKLKQIYKQELQKGNKRLWVRVTERINKSIRKIRRQAIQYKWKNCCKNMQNSLKLCENQQLIQLLFSSISEHGYKELSRQQAFNGITQSDLKNNFYSNVRSMSYFLHDHLGVSDSLKEITSMLKNRNFLLSLKAENIYIIELRRKINILKKKIAHRRKNNNDKDDEETISLKQLTLKEYSQIRKLFVEKKLEQNKGSQTTIIYQSISSDSSKQLSINQQKLQNYYYKYPTSMQFLENMKSERRIIDVQKISEFDFENYIYLNKPNQATSYEWLCNDFEF